MAEPSVLVVVYSRTGTTRDIAHELRRALDLRGIRCDVEELRERRSRRGILGYIRSAIDSSRDRPADLLPLTNDPARYDVVVVGTPVWGGSPSTPMRAFLRANAGRMARVAFFLTHGGSGGARTLRRMRVLATRAPITELALRETDIAHGRHQQAIRELAEDVANAISAPVRVETRAGGPP